MKFALILTFLFMTTSAEAASGGSLSQLEAAAKAPAIVPSVPPPAPAEEKGARPPQGLRLLRSVPSKYWERIECWQDYARPFASEPMLHKSRHETREIVDAFGTNMPRTGTFLLHYGPRWNSNTGRVVVLLHGASDNANRAWATPAVQLGDPGRPGLLQALEAQGNRVFAITFPHKHGNLFYEAQYLADAIDIIAAATGEGRFSLVGHSAGGLVGRVYVSGYRAGAGWTPYRGEVDSLVTLGTPHRGQDFAFRHPEFNYYFMKDELAANAPMSWDRVLVYGQWRDTFEFSIYSDNFPMQQQTLWDWTGRYPVSMSSPDHYTTVYGGQGYVSHSQGLNSAIMKGGNFLNGLRQYPVPPDIDVTVVAGNNNRIENVPQTEKDGPSDGLIFVDSASHTADLTHPSRTAPIRSVVLDENHVTIAFSRPVAELVTGLLR
ncbi:MAG: alpha/beta fold hydrolase [Elusimicrobiota bacterium]